MKRIKLKSPAKINLTLEVIKKLPNGFHELRTVMVKLRNIFDEITLEFNEKKEGIEIICDNEKVPCDENNICWKIAEKFFEKTGRKTGLKIKIKKNIPVVAGMGGGSAAYISGMGEKIKIIKNFPRLNLVVVNPGGEISTSWAYGELDKTLSFRENNGRKNISQEMVKNTKSCENISHLLYNDFDLVAEKKYPKIPEIKKALICLGASGASLSGKGPTVFGIFKARKEASEAMHILKRKYPKFFIAIG